jgi:hypothetical protein
MQLCPEQLKDSVSCGMFILDTTLIAPSLPHSFRPDDIPSLLRRQKVSHSKASGVCMGDAIRLKLPRTIANGDGWGSFGRLKKRVGVCPDDERGEKAAVVGMLTER